MKGERLERQFSKDCGGAGAWSLWPQRKAKTTQLQRKAAGTKVNKGCRARKMGPSLSVKESFGEDLIKSKGQWKGGLKSKACISKWCTVRVGLGQVMPLWADSQCNRNLLERATLETAARRKVRRDWQEWRHCACTEDAEASFFTDWDCCYFLWDDYAVVILCICHLIKYQNCCPVVAEEVCMWHNTFTVSKTHESSWC